MRLRKSCFISLALAVMLSLALATPAMAVPQIPHAFYGTVTVGDGPAPDGVAVSAKIGGVEYAGTTTSDGKYGYSPTFKVPGDDPDTPQVEGGVEGDTIEFCIEGTNVATYTFRNGEVTSLNLEIEELPTPPPGPGPGPPPPTYVETSLFGIEGRFRISDEGEILKTIEATSEDGMLTITIPKGTIALDENGNPLDTLEVAVDETPPNPPEDAHVIGLAYDFGPDGATFDPPITLTWSYDPADIPEGVAEEDLVLAYYDQDIGEWIELDCVVDTENNTITASFPHFTTFTIIGTVTPAAFTLSSLAVSPGEVAPGEKVSISGTVANTGGMGGWYTVVLKINGVKEAEKRVIIAAGESEAVTFSVSREDAGSYTVAVDGLSGSFTVVPVVVPPEPAAFSVSSLSIQPAEVEPGETVTVSVVVANIGGESGSYTVTLNINGVDEAEKTVTIAAGSSQTVTFSVGCEAAGSYSVTVDGLSGSFTVVAPPPGINWWMIGGIIAGVIVAALLIFFLVVRRRA